MPKIILVMIPVILAAMYYYAAFVDNSAPENTVQEFYQAYFTHDYETVASDLSVFWAAQMMPQYAMLSPQELLAKRTAAETDMKEFLAKWEGSAPTPPENIEVKVLKDYTQMGKNAAVVAYAINEDKKEIAVEAAFLIKEDGKFRIYNMAPVQRENLGQIKEFDIEQLDSQISDLIK